MSKVFERAYCYHCMTWVPPEDHIRWTDPETEIVHHKCIYCLQGIKPPKEFIRDPHLCPWCDCDTSDYLGFENGQMKRRCHNCGAEFYAID